MKTTIILSLIFSFAVSAQDQLIASPTPWDNWTQNDFQAIDWQSYSMEAIPSQEDALKVLYSTNAATDYQIEDLGLKPLMDDGGIKVGNGGKVLVCANNIFLLDYIWGIDGFNFLPREIVASNEFELAATILAPLKEKDPYRYKRYMIDLLQFSNEALILNNYRFRPTNDSTEPGIPEDCSKQVVINQIQPTLVGEIRYRIDGDLLNLLDLRTKAGLLLHEIIYKEALELGQVNDRNVAYLNAYFASTQITKDSVSDYQRKLLQAQFSYILSGVKLTVGTVLLNDAGQIIAGTIGDDSCLTIVTNSYCFKKGSTISFYPSGRIQSAKLDNQKINTYRSPDQESVLFLGHSRYTSSGIYFGESGIPIALEVEKGEVKVGQDNFLSVEENGPVTLHSNGAIESFYLQNDSKISLNDETFILSKDQKITLYPNGSLQSFLLATPSIIGGKWRWRGFIELDELGKLK